MLKSIRNPDYVMLLYNGLRAMTDFYHRIMGFSIHLEARAWVTMRVGSILFFKDPEGNLLKIYAGIYGRDMP